MDRPGVIDTGSRRLGCRTRTTVPSAKRMPKTVAISPNLCVGAEGGSTPPGGGVASSLPAGQGCW
jgi:hypothetical protein